MIPEENSIISLLFNTAFLFALISAFIYLIRSSAFAEYLSLNQNGSDKKKDEKKSKPNRPPKK